MDVLNTRQPVVRLQELVAMQITQQIVVCCEDEPDNTESSEEKQKVPPPLDVNESCEDVGEVQASTVGH